MVLLLRPQGTGFLFVMFCQQEEWIINDKTMCLHSWKQLKGPTPQD